MTDAAAEFADCAIIGGGPAGAACAIALKQHDAKNERRVILLERDSFPRYKVCGCCFNGAGASVLKSLRCEHILSDSNAVPLTKWHAQFSGKSVFANLPTGWALSRNTLDSALLEVARQAGVEVLQPAVAKLLHATEKSAEIEVSSADGKPFRLRANMGIIATGLAGVAAEKWLPWKQAPSGPIGAGAAFESSSQDYVAGTIYMACSKYGYAGIVRLENDWLDVAAALYDPAGEQRSLPLGQRISKIILESGMPPIPELSREGGSAIQWKGTPLLHRQRVVAAKSVMAVGDAAGYVEPFTGEGMAWALRTAKIAADSIARQLWSGSKSSEMACAEYATKYRSNLQHRKLPCRFLSSTLSHDLGRRLIFNSLSYFPWLTRPFIKTINAG